MQHGNILAMIRPRFVTWLGFFLYCSPIMASSQVRVWEGTMALPVYAEGPPDQNPPFVQFGGPINYPYALRENLTDKPVEGSLRAIYLENVYLKCSVLPDLGGHLYTCTDKLSGQSMFYANPSIKKARIGYRGAWAAFGDEFNFPVSHNWVSLSPVDFSYSSHADGSASVTVGNIDRVYGMEWTVEMTLRPESTVLEQKVTLANRSDVRHRFYWWNNAGVQAWEDSRICYPTHFTAAHGFADIDSWPLNTKGVDYSIIRNQQDGPVSRFVYGSREPFLGIWNPHTNAGIVHYADYGTLPGKKVWSWGDDAAGREWRRVLSDNDSTYVEVQAGPFRDQETYAYLEPRKSMQFLEYWMPIRGIGGVARANLDGILNLDRDGKALRAALNVNHKIAGASVRILDGTTPLFEKREDLSPEKTWMTEIQIPDLSRKYSFELSDASGRILLSQIEGKYDVTPDSEVSPGPQTHYVFPNPDHRTADDWQQMGDQQELNGDLLGALDTYRSGTKQFPTSLTLTISIGRLAATLQRYDEAIAVLEPAYMRNVTDPEISYYLGLSYAGAGQDRPAVTMLEAAARLQRHAAAAHLQLAELSARSGDLHNAEQHLQTAIALEPDDLRTVEEQAAVLHVLHHDARAAAFSAQALARFPNSNFLREQVGRPDLKHLASDPYRVLGIATQYMRLGMYAQAIEILSRDYPAVPSDQVEPGATLPQHHATVLYYKAFCRQKLGQPAQAEYDAAIHAPTLNVFPHGLYDGEVFRSAIRANAEDANAYYLLGAEELARGLSDDAAREWKKAASLNPRIPSLYASMGKFDLKLRNDPTAAFTNFQMGQRNDPENADVYTGLDQTMSLLGRSASERSSVLDRFPHLDLLPQSLVYELALTKSEAHDIAGATAIFSNRFFSSGEGDTDVRQIWVEVRLQHAVQLAGMGKCEAATAELHDLRSPVDRLAWTGQIPVSMVNDARTQYIAGTIYKTCGLQRAATDTFRSVEKSSAPNEVYWAVQAAKQSGSYVPGDWRNKLLQARALSENRISSPDASYWTYVSALIDRELGDAASAESKLRNGLRLPDRLLAYHLIRLARINDGADTQQSSQKHISLSSLSTVK